MTTTLIIAAITAGLAQTQNPGPAPTFSVVQSISPKNGQVVLSRTILRQEQVAVSEKVFENGNAVERIRLITRVVSHEVGVTYELGNARVITPDGKQLPIDAVWKRLTRNSVVAISGDFSVPSAVFLRALNPQTLVIIPSRPNPSSFPKGG